MTTSVTLTKSTWIQLNTEYPVLITGGPYRLFMNGNEAPDDDSPSHLMSKVRTIPAGVGAYIKGYQEGVVVVVSAMVPGDVAPVVPFEVASPEEEEEESD